MKKISLILMAAAALVSSCSKGDDTSSSVGYGSVGIASEVDPSTQVVVKSSDIYEIPEAFIPSADDFQLSITGEYIDVDDASTQQFDQTFDNVTAYNTYEKGTSPINLWSGNYVATLISDYDTSIESTTNACFGAEPAKFEVVGDVFDASTTITIELINSIIRLSADDWFKYYFSSASLTVTTGAGNEFTFDPFSADNDDVIVFVEPNTELTLKGTAQRASSGATVTFSESTVATTAAGEMTSIIVKATSVGGMTITITVDSEILGTIEEEYEFNPLED
ncbi:MAG: DUF4493 domain-containing protein [Rikenellaceae bacterium]